jgi:hypothetical protein
MNRIRAAVAAAISLVTLASCGGAGAPDSPAPAPDGGVRFRDVAAAAGLDVVQVGGGAGVDFIIESLGSGGAWLDHDGDGDPDLYLAEGATPERPREGPPDRLLRNDGDADGDGVPAFTDVTAAAGLGDRLWSFGVAVADYDGDGDPDIYLTNWGPNRLYRNDGDGTFTEIGAAAGVDDGRWGASAIWGDVDRDGDLDLFVVNYVEFDFATVAGRGEPGPGGGPPCTWRDVEVFCGPVGLEPAQNVLFRNDGDADGDGVPAFTDVTRDAGLVTSPAHYGLAALFFDSDDDGDLDLYVANDSVANTYFINRGNGTFEEAGVLSGLAFNEQGHEQASMGIAASDVDGNGRLDLIVTNFSHDHDTLYRNEGGHVFTDISYAAGIGGPSYLPLAWGVAFVDVDHDGREDLFVGHGHVYPQVDERDMGTTFRQRNSLFLGVGDARFEEITDGAGPGLELVKGTRAVLPADADGDGDLDFLLTNLNDTPDLLLNEGAAGNWLQVRLHGAGANRDGIGARVVLEAAGRRQIREMSRTASYAGSTLPVAHFGLGAAAAGRVEVRWSSGRITVRENVQANRTLRIREDE